MTIARRLVAALVVSLTIHAVQASELEQTGSIDGPTDVEVALEARSDVPAPETTPAGAASTPVALPKLSVTAVTPVSRPLPPLKPLPKWDPHVCIGC